MKMSEAICENNFVETYTECNDMIVKTIEGCSSRKKKNKGWKIHRKLLINKKRIGKVLKEKKYNKRRNNSIKNP